ncbi:MAG: endonuclease/exonuclease/phosphatase family protein [Cyanobacteria bacterium P01_H01_bin.74]
MTIIWQMAGSVVFLLILLSGLTFLNTSIWSIEFLSNCRHLILAAGFLLSVLFLLGRRWLFLIMGIICIVLNAPPMMPLFSTPAIMNSDKAAVQSEVPTPRKKLYKMVIFNTYMFNYSATELANFLEAVHPDFVCLSEVVTPTFQTLQKNKAIASKYPYNAFDYNTQSLLLSKYPINSIKKIEGTAQYLRSVMLQTQVTLGNKPLAIWLTHPPHPTSPLNYQKKLDFLNFFKSERLPEHLIVAGDFNMSPWSNQFQNFLDITQLQCASFGFGFQPTWPSSQKIIPLFPIDHAFYQGDVEVNSWKVVDQSFGSDHLPVVMDFLF